MKKVCSFALSLFVVTAAYGNVQRFSIVSRNFDNGPQKLVLFATGTLAAAPVSEKPQPADKPFLVNLKLKLKPDQFTLPGEWAMVNFSTYECAYKSVDSWRFLQQKCPAKCVPQTLPASPAVPGYVQGSMLVSFCLALPQTREKLVEVPFELYVTCNSATPDSHVVPPRDKADLRLSGILRWELDRDGKFARRPEIDDFDCEQCVLLVSSNPKYPQKRVPEEAPTSQPAPRSCDSCPP